MIDNFIEWFIDGFMRIILLIFIMSIILGIPLEIYAYYQDAKKPTFELKKDEWSCSLEHEYSTTNIVLVGKIMVPQMVTHHDCIRWEHK